MFPSGGFVSGFNPNSGSNTFVDDAVESTGATSVSGGSIGVRESVDNSSSQIDRKTDALSALYELGKSQPEYMELYLQLLAERENTTMAQKWYEDMSGSQYSRAYKDLENAGINPYLALQSLGGAGAGSVQVPGTWSTSPYANRENAKNQRTTATSNMIKALLGAGTALTAILALLL